MIIAMKIITGTSYTFSASILQLQDVLCDSELQSLLLKEEYAFISDCGYLKAAHLITQQDVLAIVQAVCLDY